VEHVYPSIDRLPENQLKFYVHFSAPMSRGEAYRHISLLNSAGNAVELPFLELEQELWDPTGTRLTLLFDPGRIKRGLVPHNDVGPALEAGGSYVLVVDAGWHDASGTPLGGEFRKKFTAVAADRDPPDPAKWTLSPPRQTSQDGFEVRFPEPMDRALLERMLTVKSPAGKTVKGRVFIDNLETVWRFIPDDPWNPGPYILSIDTALEDLAGNRLGRPFDVDLFEPISKQIVREEQLLQFTFASH